MATAAQRVFAIPELLEKILANLTLDNLYSIQRTNKTFKTAMADSKQLRTTMGLEITEMVVKQGLPRGHPLLKVKVQEAIQPLVLTISASQKSVILSMSLMRRYEQVVKVSHQKYCEDFLEKYQTSEVEPTWRKLRVGCKDYSLYVRLWPSGGMMDIAPQDTLGHVVTTALRQLAMRHQCFPVEVEFARGR